MKTVTTIPKLPRRAKDSHKGDFGRVLVIAGSRGMIGAPALVANAALRSGAGLVIVACPESIQTTVAALCPCATSIPLPEDGEGKIDVLAALKHFKRIGLLEKSTAPSVVAVGPGIGRGSPPWNVAWLKLYAAFGEQASVPLVIDADGINTLDSTSHDLSNAVLTPHPGEMARLRGLSTKEVQAQRQKIALETAKQLSAVIVLKGHQTLVTDGQKIYTNKTGNPGMATGGTGDILTGIIAGLIAQGLSRFDAAILGVHLHGLAGDLAAKELGEVSLIATDLLDYLPAVFNSRRR